MGKQVKNGFCSQGHHGKCTELGEPREARAEGGAAARCHFEPFLALLEAYFGRETGGKEAFSMIFGLEMRGNGN